MLQKWIDDPQASAGLFVAFVAGVFALYQLRSFPADRRRRVLEAMIEKYSESAALRSQVLQKFPPLMALGYRAISQALDGEIADRQQRRADLRGSAAAIADVSLQRLDLIKRDLRIWNKPSLSLSYQSAAEILASEAKIRALLWSIARLRGGSPSSDVIDPRVLDAARAAVNSLNDFAFEYENGGFPAREMYGQLHRSIAPAVKALEPLIWEKGIEGRWGRRVLRLGLGAQHYNDVSTLHRISNLVWSTAAGSNGIQAQYVIHPARTIDVLGREVADIRVPGEPRLLPIVRLNLRRFYWRFVGMLALKPSVTFWTFGGLRLRRHVKAEPELISLLRFACDPQHGPDEYSPLNFDWTLKTLREQLDAATRAGVATHGGGRLAWLYARPPAS